MGKELIIKHLAACVNILPKITSIYSWEGKIESDQEQLLLIKSNNETYPAVEHFIAENHPYELPEIIAVPLQHGSNGYLNWISQWLDSK